METLHTEIKPEPACTTLHGLPEISVIIPANNESDSIASVIDRIHQVMESQNRSYEIITIDDGSEDGTGQVARAAGARVVRHPYNIGNGAAIKTGIRNARGELLVMMDADGQHPPEDIPHLVEKLSTYHMVVGSRTQNSESSPHRNFANRIYNLFASYVCGRRIDDLTSGFRAIRADLAHEFASLLPNSFSYPTTLTMATLRSGYSLTFVPFNNVKRQGKGKSKIKLFRDGVRFFLIIFKVATLFSPMRIFLPVSLLTFLLGLGYGLFKIFILEGRYGPTSSLLMTVSILMFLIGLVSEQVAQLRFDRTTATYQCQTGCPFFNGGMHPHQASAPTCRATQPTEQSTYPKHPAQQP